MIANASDIARVAARIRERGGPAAVLTGAGVSVESGIPDFRSAGGIWKRFDPGEYASIQAFLRNPAKVWRFLLELGDLLASARPNPAHDALAALERAGKVAGIITQNVDGLHQIAGSRRVLELHGGGQRLRCLQCGAVEAHTDRDYLRSVVGSGRAPTCERCGGVLKPDVVLFGEDLPAAVLDEAQDLARRSPVLIVAGTSATVWPAAGIPSLAARHGALVVEVNKEETDLTGDVAHETLIGSAGDVLAGLSRELLGTRS